MALFLSAFLTSLPHTGPEASDGRALERYFYGPKGRCGDSRYHAGGGEPRNALALLLVVRSSHLITLRSDACSLRKV